MEPAQIAWRWGGRGFLNLDLQLLPGGGRGRTPPRANANCCPGRSDPPKGLAASANCWRPGGGRACGGGQLGPLGPLEAVPLDEWFCPGCQDKGLYAVEAIKDKKTMARAHRPADAPADGRQMRPLSSGRVRSGTGGPRHVGAGRPAPGLPRERSHQRVQREAA